MISIKVPATSANLGSGFDSLGVALNWYNYVWMEESDRIEISSKDNVAIPKGKDILILFTVRNQGIGFFSYTALVFYP